MSRPTRLKLNGKAFQHVLTALIAKRREIAGQIEDLQRRLKLAVTELDNVESTIRIFKPTSICPNLGRVQCRRLTRRSRRIVTHPDRRLARIGDAAQHPSVDRNRDERSRNAGGRFEVRRIMQQRVGASLNNWKRVKKVLKSSPGPGDMLIWEIDRNRIAAAHED